MISWNCMICGCNQSDYLYRGKDRLHFIAGEFYLYRCRGCGLIFIHPFLDQKELARFYPEEYSPYNNCERQSSPPISAKQKAFYYLRHPVCAMNALIYSKALGQNRDVSVSIGTKVLDIGCGDGGYLLNKRQKGADCYGIDISVSALQRLNAKDPEIKTFNGALWDADFADGMFDLVNLCQVLEHVTDAEKLLVEIRRVLKKDGRFRLQVPNTSSLTRHIFGKYWIAFDVPRHVYDFSKTNLRRFLEKRGYVVEGERTIENAYDLIGSALYVFNGLFNNKIKLSLVPYLWDSEWLKLLLSPYALFVNLLKVGDTVEFVLRKA